MVEKLSKVIQNQELFSKKDLLLVGVSGGIDSMVLSHLLYEANYSFIIAHCNYHLRGLESDLDEELVKNWANEHSIPFFSKSCMLSNPGNVQEVARELRYSFFNDLKESENCKYILTAHHENDQLETFFINLSRGAGLKGLKGMSAYTNGLIRPLLAVSKNDILNYALKYLIPYREDQSNQSSHYLRNYFRNEIIPIINKRIPNFSELCLRSMDHLSELDILMDQVYLEWKMEVVENYTEGIKFVKPNLNKFYLISKLLVELGFHPETIHQLKMNYFIVGKIFTDKNKHELLVDRDFIQIRFKHPEADLLNYEITGEQGIIQIKENQFTWQTNLKINDPIPLPDTNSEALFDCNELKQPLFIRNWLPGDIINPLGMNGKTKKIQDVLTNNKVSVFDKENIYVLISGETILWVPGIMRSEVAKINKNTTTYFKIVRK